MKGHGMHSNALFDQAKEEHAAMGGLATVEPEGKFVQVSLQVVFFAGALMRAHQPALNQCCHAVYARQNLIGFLTGALNRCAMMNVIVFSCARIGIQSIGVNCGAWLDVFLDKLLERFCFRVGNNLQATASKTFWREQFNGDGHHHLAIGTAPAFAVPDATKNSFIHLDVPGQHVMPGMADSAPEAVQHCPCRRIGAKPKDSMQRFGGDAILGERYMPGGGKPNRQRGSCAMKDCASGRGNPVAARITPPFAVLHAPTFGAVARRALKAVFPAQPVKIVEASRVIMEPRQKLGVVARVIGPGFGMALLFGGVR